MNNRWAAFAMSTTSDFQLIGTLVSKLLSIVPILVEALDSWHMMSNSDGWSSDEHAKFGALYNAENLQTLSIKSFTC